MGAPFNFLQFFLINYSGREIGIAQYKPYTFANEKGNVSVGVYGAMFPVFIEKANITTNPTSSGNQSSALGDIGSVGLNYSGQQVAQPSDVKTFIAGYTGNMPGFPNDTPRYSLSFTGTQSSAVGDIFNPFGLERLTGLFDSAISETGNRLMNSVNSGNLKRTDRDVCSMTFLFLTGSYSSGAFTPFVPPVNHPLTGLDSPIMTFVMFTGTYQGA